MRVCVRVAADLVFHSNDKWCTNASYGGYLIFRCICFFFLSFFFPLLTIGFFFILSTQSKFRRNSWFDRTMGDCMRCTCVCVYFVCCHSCNTHLTMMFLWVFGWREYNNSAVPFIQYEYVFSILLVWRSYFLVVCCFFVLLFSRGITIRRYWQKYVCINVWLFGADIDYGRVRML